MFGFSFGEVLFIAAIALIALGPKQLPEVARTVGRLLNELRRASGDFQRSLLDANNATDKTFQTLQQSIQDSLEDKKPAEPTPQVAGTYEDQGHGHGHMADIEGDEVNQLSFELGKTKKNES